jgi:hypothetical protein
MEYDDEYDEYSKEYGVKDRVESSSKLVVQYFTCMLLEYTE